MTSAGLASAGLASAGLARGGLRRRCGDGAGILAVGQKHGDRGVDRDIVGAFRDHDLAEPSLVDGLDFHGRLVGLDLGDDIAGLAPCHLRSSAIWRACPSPWSATARASGYWRRHVRLVLSVLGPLSDRARLWRRRRRPRRSARPASRDWPHRASARPCRRRGSPAHRASRRHGSSAAPRSPSRPSRRGQPSSTVTQRLVFLTLSTMVAMSIGRSVRRSIDLGLDAVLRQLVGGAQRIGHARCRRRRW